MSQTKQSTKTVLPFSAQEVLALAKEAGKNISLKQAEQFLREIQKEQEKELTLEDLDQIAGGYTHDEIIKILSDFADRFYSQGYYENR